MSEGDRALAAGQPDNMVAPEPPPPPRIGVALSGGGHRAACWSAGALLSLADLEERSRIVSVVSVSGGSIANAAVAAAGDLRGAHSAVLQEWLKPGLKQWAHDGLFFPGPGTDRWLARTLALLTAAVVALVSLLIAAMSAGRDLSADAIVLTSAVVLVAVFLVAIALAVRVMPTLRLALGVITASTLAWPFTIGSLVVVSISSSYVVLLVALTAIVWSLAIRRFGRRSLAVELALGRVFARDGRPIGLAELHDQPVHHVFCAADLDSGNNLYLSNRLVWGHPGIAALPGRVELARAVQSSACLPGAFLARHFPQLATDPPMRRAVVLSDGGVYDNMADQWEWGFATRVATATKAADPPNGLHPLAILQGAQPFGATHLVVVNASRGMISTRDLDTEPGLGGELRSALGAKDVLYDVSTATRRRLLIDMFDGAAASGTGLDGILVHIGTSPYTIIDRFAAGKDQRGQRALEVRAVLDACTDADDEVPPNEEPDEANARRRATWAKTAQQNASVKTTLAPLESLRAGSSAALLHHAWVVTTVAAAVLHGWGMTPLPHVEQWRRQRFTAMVDESKGAA
jgi:patatin-like phospholipase